MGSLLSNIGQTRARKSNFLSNYDIQNIFIENENSNNEEWKHLLFNEISFLAISRIKKYKKKYEIDDLRQTIYLGIWKGVKSFDPHKNFDFYRWINWNINSEVRKFKKNSSSDDSINLLYENTSELKEIEDNLYLNIFKSKLILSDREKKVVFSYYFEGESLNEIGKSLNLSIEAIRKIRNTAISKIKKNL